ncbi:DUF6900 domain-containing protein [Thermopirellula anaerolimosa]
MPERQTKHLDYAQEAEAAQRAEAWPQAAALWRRAASVADTKAAREQYLFMARHCNRRTHVDGNLEKIAKDVLGIQTAWHARGTYDVHVELPIGKVKLALRAAYEAGRAATK